MPRNATGFTVVGSMPWKAAGFTVVSTVVGALVGALVGGLVRVTLLVVLEVVVLGGVRLVVVLVLIKSNSSGNQKPCRIFLGPFVST